jgi:hypothetical protein
MTEPAARPNLLPVIIGIALTAALLAGLAWLSRERRAAEAGRAPQLAIVAPRRGDTIPTPAAVTFTSARPIELQPTGWGYDNLHLHADVNGVEIMPAAADITPQDSTYVWTFPDVRPGQFAVRLGWADEQHRPITAGASNIVTGIVR